MIEQILQDLCASQPAGAADPWRICLLRYFNPVGAHPSGQLGEDPNGLPNNLMPIICSVAMGKLPELLLTGNDYDTPDGTCIRDFIHVVDLALGHLKALDKTAVTPGCSIYNLGTGKGLSVKELVTAFEAVSGITLKKRIAPRRPGDIARSYADVSKAEHELGWKAQRSAEDMCRDVWHYLQGQDAKS